MDRKIKIVLAIADIGVATFLICLVLFHLLPTFTISYDAQQLIWISGASGAGITLLYWKRLKDYNPKLTKLLELLLYLVGPTVASIPLLAKVSYYLILIVCYPAIIGWFNFGLIQIGKGEERIDKETRTTIGIMIGMLLFFLVVITWLITIICAYQCKNP